MNALKTLVAATAVVVAFGSLCASEAQAASEKYAVTSITNRTNLTIHYEFKWGNGEWRQASLQPGHTMHHSWTYEYRGQNRSPVKLVRFDSDLRTGKILTVTKEVKSNACYNKSEGGKLYVIEFEDGDRDYIVLREVDLD
jgi:hypothetical protein